MKKILITLIMITGLLTQLVANPTVNLSGTVKVDGKQSIKIAQGSTDVTASNFSKADCDILNGGAVKFSITNYFYNATAAKNFSIEFTGDDYFSGPSKELIQVTKPKNISKVTLAPGYHAEGSFQGDSFTVEWTGNAKAAAGNYSYTLTITISTC